MVVTLKNPEAPATKNQLAYLRELTGADNSLLGLNMQQASDKIENLELARLAHESELNNLISDDNEDTQFNEAHVVICEGDQGGGKTVYAVGRIVDAYRLDCVKIYCETVLKIECEVKAYYKKDRVAKIKLNGKNQYIKIPESYELRSPMHIFSNIHLYGIPYVYVPTYRHMLAWLKAGIIRDGWLLMDEAHQGMSARNGMSREGREWVGQLFQFRKSLLNVVIITHHAKMIEMFARTVPTQHVHCNGYNKKTHEVAYTLRKKGIKGTEEKTFDASQYFPNYKTNEKVNA